MSRKVQWKARPRSRSEALKYGLFVYKDKPKCKICGNCISESLKCYVFSNRDVCCTRCKVIHEPEGFSVECAIIRCSYEEFISSDGWNLRNFQELLGVKYSQKIIIVLVNDTETRFLRIIAYSLDRQKMYVLKIFKPTDINIAIDIFDALEITTVNNIREQIQKMFKDKIDNLNVRVQAQTNQTIQNEIISSVRNLMAAQLER